MQELLLVPFMSSRAVAAFCCSQEVDYRNLDDDATYVINREPPFHLQACCVFWNAQA